MENPNYPFIKITREAFPRPLATRRPSGGDKVFGAFLPAVSVRYLLDLIIRVFRLRSCELEIDGSFDAPCPEYFLHRCLAPCVAKLCNEKTYLNAVEDVELFLEGRGEIVLQHFDREIEVLSENLEFEKAKEILQKRKIIAGVLSDSKWKMRLEDATDVLTAKLENGQINFYLTTLRRGRIIGQNFFKFDLNEEINREADVFAPFIKSFYKFYLPKQIYVSHDFAAKTETEKFLHKKFGRKIKITAALPENLPPTVLTARRTAEIFQSNKNLRRDFDTGKLLGNLRSGFNLQNLPRRIECFDVAHLAGEAIVAARVLAVDLNLQNEDEIVWQFENLSETESLARGVAERLRILPSAENLPAFFLLDGGRPQISAVRKILTQTEFLNLTLVGAVKPSKRHAEIAYFLLESGARIAFDKQNAAHQFLQKMRDAAHALANSTHRSVYSLAAILAENSNAPKIRLLHVPLRITERGGFADDLQPLRALNQAGELLYKSRKPPEISGEKYKRRSRFRRKID